VSVKADLLTSSERGAKHRQRLRAKALKRMGFIAEVEDGDGDMMGTGGGDGG